MFRQDEQNSKRKIHIVYIWRCCRVKNRRKTKVFTNLRLKNSSSEEPLISLSLRLSTASVIIMSDKVRSVERFPNVVGRTYVSRIKRCTCFGSVVIFIFNILARRSKNQPLVLVSLLCRDFSDISV